MSRVDRGSLPPAVLTVHAARFGPNKLGVTNGRDLILLHTDLSRRQAAETLLHEVAHVILGHDTEQPQWVEDELERILGRTFDELCALPGGEGARSRERAFPRPATTPAPVAARDSRQVSVRRGGAAMLDVRGWATVPPSWRSAGIVDARAFRVGDSPTVHALTHAAPNKVRGACGVVAHVSERGTRLASWAGVGVDCPTCLGTGRSWAPITDLSHSPERSTDR